MIPFYDADKRINNAKGSKITFKLYIDVIKENPKKTQSHNQNSTEHFPIFILSFLLGGA